MADNCLTFKENDQLFSQLVLFYIPTTSVWEFQFLHILLILAILIAVHGYVIVVLTSISLMNDAVHLFKCLFAIHISFL